MRQPPTVDFEKKNENGHFRTTEFRKKKLEVGTQLPTSDFFFKIQNGSLTVPYNRIHTNIIESQKSARQAPKTIILALL